MGFLQGLAGETSAKVIAGGNRLFNSQRFLSSERILRLLRAHGRIEEYLRFKHVVDR